MGWFDEQIKERKRSDDALFEESFVNMADAVLGSRRASAFQSDDARTKTAIDEILRWYHLKPRDIPDSVKGFEDRLEYCLRPYGIMHRRIILEPGWYRDAIGPILAHRRDDSTAVPLLPKGLSGYVYFDAASGCWTRINRKNIDLFETEATCFYKPFPLKKLNILSILRYMADCLSVSDFVLVALGTLAVTLVGLLTPKLNNLLFGKVAESGDLRLLIGISVFMRKP